MVLLGDYPQSEADQEVQSELRQAYKKYKMVKTKRKYMIGYIGQMEFIDPKDRDYDVPFILEEFEYNGKRYIRVPIYHFNNVVYFEVEPVRWYVDKKNRYLISERCLLSGIPFCNDGAALRLNFSTDMDIFLRKYMLPNLLQERKEVIRKERHSKSIIVPKISDNTINNIKNQISLDDSISSEEMDLLLSAIEQEENNNSRNNNHLVKRRKI